jgi:pullulanase
MATPGQDLRAESVREGAAPQFRLSVAIELSLMPKMRVLPHARAHWLTRDTIAWNLAASPGYSYRLHSGESEERPPSVRSHFSLALAPAGLSRGLREKYPHLASCAALILGAGDLAHVPELLKSQLAVSARDEHDRLVEETGLQIPGVLDDLYPYTGPLGIVYRGDIPTLTVWAPTAQSVNLRLFDDSTTSVYESVPMQWQAATGVWSVAGQASWTHKFYLYDVRVFVPETGETEQNLVTDPYSLSLSKNSLRSQIVNLAGSALKPAGWDALQKPPLETFTDSVIYELHVRDFSIGDGSVSPGHRGKFMAFTEHNSQGMLHLGALASAGLTHIHLLPAFDFASVNDDEAQRVEPDAVRLAAFPPESEEQQAAVGKVAAGDGFNWGYDPFHYGVPEGSYATEPDGPARILEFRSMVQALNRAGLRVVMDVVYNHTAFGGQHAQSVLDKIVPGYYYRLDAEGKVETSTCCQNTATEHHMMEKLMLDTLRQWATAYKVDGFRFDLMGHHLRDNMLNVRRTLDELTLEKDGVAGRQIYIYGEGWDFGEVAHNARGANAAQLNLGGLGIGSFNDRLRDAARGGRPFSGLQEQGFLTGLFNEPNASQPGSPEEQKALLLHLQDWIRIGLAGNLRDYTLVDARGRLATGAEIDYYGQPAGYTLSPQECVNYVSAHDNETLFDAIQLKVPASLPLPDRLRMHRLGLSLVLLGQGIPFFHAGDDMLRSKSLDRNSYNSGDWFNKLDFTYETNNWGVGLPPAGDNGAHWPVLKPLLANPALRPSRADILSTVAHFRELLRIRRSSRLLRLETADEIGARLTFFNTGPEQIPGLIALVLSNTLDSRLDDAYRQMVVVFNATPLSQTLVEPALAGLGFVLHPVLVASADWVVRQSGFEPEAGAFVVPARTAAVFVR